MSLEVSKLPSGRFVQGGFFGATVKAHNTLVENREHTNEPYKSHDVFLIDIGLERTGQRRRGHHGRQCDSGNIQLFVFVPPVGCGIEMHPSLPPRFFAPTFEQHLEITMLPLF